MSPESGRIDRSIRKKSLRATLVRAADSIDGETRSTGRQSDFQIDQDWLTNGYRGSWPESRANGTDERSSARYPLRTNRTCSEHSRPESCSNQCWAIGLPTALAPAPRRPAAHSQSQRPLQRAQWGGELCYSAGCRIAKSRAKTRTESSWIDGSHVIFELWKRSL